MPDFSGAPPVQVEECGFHSEQRKRLTNLRPAAPLSETPPRGTAKVPEGEPMRLLLEIHAWIKEKNYPRPLRWQCAIDRLLSAAPSPDGNETGGAR
jgi:hypothetical protein